MHPDRPAAHDVIVVLRLWTEAHDPRRPRARLLTGAGDPGEPLIGTTAILKALERVVRSFELEADSGHGGHADETRVQRPR
ncbi:hypothetical protein IEZ26_13580 [Nocardioides cavernae]|uniref:Uncharacterized protein n=1 Tax=Nocardioides cavernae TaxID=1921566 RepID=A0ABR8NC07_9ACTN|nr:hypothetical protein [Nocardioides cavernae]MBD3925659.1 hypothetical protein [Nocardioides cavernae]MBM7513242.1 hypothetical protein [Nocardioides cavernae]